MTTLTTLTILNTPTKVTNLTTLTFRLIKGKQEVNCGSHIVYFVLLCLISVSRLYIQGASVMANHIWCNTNGIPFIG